jgi:hypothetical protein
LADLKIGKSTLAGFQKLSAPRNLLSNKKKGFALAGWKSFELTKKLLARSSYP